MSKIQEIPIKVRKEQARKLIVEEMDHRIAAKFHLTPSTNGDSLEFKESLVRGDTLRLYKDGKETTETIIYDLDSLNDSDCRELNARSIVTIEQLANYSPNELISDLGFSFAEATAINLEVSEYMRDKVDVEEKLEESEEEDDLDDEEEED